MIIVDRSVAAVCDRSLRFYEVCTDVGGGRRLLCAHSPPHILRRGVVLRRMMCGGECAVGRWWDQLWGWWICEDDPGVLVPAGQEGASLLTRRNKNREQCVWDNLDISGRI